MELFMCVLGMVLVFEGLPYFTFPDRMKAYMEFVLQQDNVALRVMGGIMVFLGLLIIFVARRAPELM